MTDISILILAAGRGTRMYSDLPKVLHTIGHKTMLQHVIDTAQTLDPKFIGVVVGHGKEMVQSSVSSDVVWIEQNEQLGTGHAVSCAIDKLPDNGYTLILYGDVPLIDTETLREIVQKANDDTLVILTDSLDNPTGYGRILRDNQQNVVGIVEEKDANDEQKKIQEVNTGIFVIPNNKLAVWIGNLSCNNQQKEYYLTDIVGMAVADKLKVSTVLVREHYLSAGVNNKLQQAQLERIYQQNNAIALMQKGVTLHDPNRFDLRGKLVCGRDVVIGVNNVFYGNCELADGVVIEENCVLNNVKISAKTRIRAFSHLENCTIGNNAQIGPFARIRPDSVLADNVHIGNFVEIKKSTVGEGSKVNHLSYIGDSDIGKHSNIGAGSITCNYDGVNKFRTEIGDNAFIGSNTLLVAPVKVGSGATTGAGSVITKDCPNDKLTIARSRQQTISHWIRPVKK